MLRRQFVAFDNIESADERRILPFQIAAFPNNIRIVFERDPLDVIWNDIKSAWHSTHAEYLEKVRIPFVCEYQVNRLIRL